MSSGRATPREESGRGDRGKRLALYPGRRGVSWPLRFLCFVSVSAPRGASLISVPSSNNKEAPPRAGGGGRPGLRRNGSLGALWAVSPRRDFVFIFCDWWEGAPCADRPFVKGAWLKADHVVQAPSPLLHVDRTQALDTHMGGWPAVDRYNLSME